MSRALPSGARQKRGKVQSGPAPDITDVDMEEVARGPRKSLAKSMGGKDVRPRKQPARPSIKPRKKDFKSFSGLYNTDEAANG